MRFKAGAKGKPVWQAGYYDRAGTRMFSRSRDTSLPIRWRAGLVSSVAHILIGMQHGFKASRWRRIARRPRLATVMPVRIVHERSRARGILRTKGDPRVALLPIKQNSVLGHCFAQQRSHGGVGSSFRSVFQALIASRSSASSFDLIDRLITRDLRSTLMILASISRFSFLQNVARVFNAVTADFGSFQSGFDVVGQGDDGAFGVNFFHDALDDSALVVDSNEVGERSSSSCLMPGRCARALGQPTG